MIFLLDDIKNHLKTLTYNYDVTVRPSNSKLTPTYPLITIDEIDNSVKQSINGVEKYSRVTYQIDIYSKDMYPSSALTVLKSLASTVSDEIQTYYGLLRQNMTIMPDVNDETVTRMTMRFTGTLDPINEVIYK
jgi:hypothetical protein